MQTKDKIEQILKKNFTTENLEVTDESHLHRGHSEAQKSGGGHFAVLIVSNDFKGKSLIERHRMIHRSLKEELKGEIHALAIRANTPEEAHKES